VLHGLHVLSGHISTRRLTASGSRPLDIGKILEGERSAMASRATALSIYFFSSCPIRSARVSLAPSSSLSDNECAWLIGAVVGLLQGSKTLQHDTVRERRPNAERASSSSSRESCNLVGFLLALARLIIYRKHCLGTQPG
jgi:hypothetical protein